MSEEAARRTDIPLQPHSRLRVTIANGERVSCSSVMRRATFSMDDEAFVGDQCALPLGGYEMVPGTQWLATLGPILRDFGRLFMSF